MREARRDGRDGDVPVFVFAFAPNPPKVLLVALVLDWPKPPLPKPKADMMGDVSGWRGARGEMEAVELVWEKKREALPPLRVENQNAMGRFLKARKQDAENARRNPGRVDQLRGW